MRRSQLNPVAISDGAKGLMAIITGLPCFRRATAKQTLIAIVTADLMALALMTEYVILIQFL